MNGLFKILRPSSFAPATRKNNTEVMLQYDSINNQPMDWSLLNMIPELSMILKSDRQIVFANKAILDFLSIEDASQILGLRPGEALNCIHAENDSGGCGTTDFCRMCGAVNSILETQETHVEDMRECEISTSKGSAYNLRIWTYPFNHGNEKFILCTIRDIADEKYRQILEHIFFHDLINIGAGLCGLIDIIGRDTSRLDTHQSTLKNLAQEIIDEINAQRDIYDAEQGKMPVQIQNISSGDILNSVTNMYSRHHVAMGKNIVIMPESHDVHFESDAHLLTRILGNMIKNALEAIRDGETVCTKSFKTGDTVRFEISNPGVIPHDEQLQIFNRSFSTKGKGRGLGTYSIKLLTQNYLQGKAGFTSTKESGTIFFIELPLQFNQTVAY